MRNFSSTTAGIKLLKVIAGTLETSFNIMVLNSLMPPQEPAILNFNIVSLPQKRTYCIGDTLDLSGGLLAATYTDGSIDTLPISADMVRGFSNQKEGRLLLTIKAGSFTSAFTIDVVRKSVETIDTLPFEPIVITKVSVETLPLKLEYKIGDSLDVSGGSLSVLFSNDSTSTIAMQDSMVSGFDSETSGLKMVTVEYGNTINIFSVYVVADTLTPPDDTTSIAEETLCEPAVYIVRNSIIIENATSEIYIYDTMGRMVSRHAATNHLIVQMKHTGVYILKTGKTTKKVMLEDNY